MTTCARLKEAIADARRLQFTQWSADINNVRNQRIYSLPQSPMSPIAIHFYGHESSIDIYSTSALVRIFTEGSGTVIQWRFRLDRFIVADVQRFDSSLILLLVDMGKLYLLFVPIDSFQKTRTRTTNNEEEIVVDLNPWINRVGKCF